MNDIDVGEGWRRLAPGEVIRDGDQYWSLAEAMWLNTDDAGRVLWLKDSAYYRRRSADEARPATLRERTPGEAAAYAEGMAATVVADLMRERDAARAECERLSAANRELDRVVNALESRVSELKAALKLAREGAAMGDSSQPSISGAGKSGGSGNQEPVKYAVIVGGEMKNTVYDDFAEARDKARDIACRGTPHFVGVVALYREPREKIPAPASGGEAKQEPRAWAVLGRGIIRAISVSRSDAEDAQSQFACDTTLVPLYAAPPEPRGWLTAEEREAVGWMCNLFRRPRSLGPDVAAPLRSLLARESPPRVKVPHLDDLEEMERPVWESACKAWIDAIRAAGGEVDE